mmetsp:Transcript_23294/g.26433  ORF Transcript_23294/g.26433 Transcript_23294/m.26433 type:complete len:792 (+) Transcript_23294:31-2406(+)
MGISKKHLITMLLMVPLLAPFILLVGLGSANDNREPFNVGFPHQETNRRLKDDGSEWQPRMQVKNTDDSEYTIRAGMGKLDDQIQWMELLFDTTSVESWLTSSQCENCANPILFNESGTTKIEDKKKTVTVGLKNSKGYPAQGDVFLDSVDPKHALSKLSYLLIRNEDQLPNDQVSGSIGGGYGLSEDEKDQATFVKKLVQKNLIPKEVFTVHYSSLYSPSKEESWIEFGKVSEEGKTGNYEYHQNANNERFTIKTKDVIIGDKELNISEAFISTTEPSIAVSPKVYEQIIDFLQSQGRYTPRDDTYCTVSNWPNLTITFTKKSFTLTPNDYLSFNPATQHCFLAITSNDDLPTSTSIILGTPFLRTVSAVFDYEKSRIGLAGSLNESPVYPQTERMLTFGLTNSSDEQYTMRLGMGKVDDEVQWMDLLYDTSSLENWLAAADCEQCWQEGRFDSEGATELDKDIYTVGFNEGHIHGSWGTGNVFVKEGDEGEVIEDLHYLVGNKFIHLPFLPAAGSIGGAHIVYKKDAKKETFTKMLKSQGFISERIVTIHYSSAFAPTRESSWITFGEASEKGKTQDYEYNGHVADGAQWFTMSTVAHFGRKKLDVIEAFVHTASCALLVSKSVYRDIVDQIIHSEDYLDGDITRCLIKDFPDLKLTFSERTYIMKPVHYIGYKPETGACFLNIEPRILPADDIIVLGLPFLRTVNIVLDYDRNQIGLAASDNADPQYAAGSRPLVPVWGWVLLGLVLFLLALFGLFCFRRKNLLRKARDHRILNEEAMGPNRERSTQI